MKRSYVLTGYGVISLILSLVLFFQSIQFYDDGYNEYVFKCNKAAVGWIISSIIILFLGIELLLKERKNNQ